MDERDCYRQEIPGASEFVRVRRDDLEKAIDFMEHSAGVYWITVCKRLKAALETQCHDQ
jgi:hypothetical protein